MLILEDRNHKMPVITPTHPHQNACLNINKTTLTEIQNAIQIGAKAVHEGKMNELFKEKNFLEDFKSFVLVELAGNINEIKGYLDSKMKNFMTKAENHDGSLPNSVWYCHQRKKKQAKR